MSNSGTISLAEFIQIYTEEVYDSIIVNRLLYAGLTIMVWDTVLTLGEEIDVIWRRRLSLGSYLYIISRYGTMLSLFINCFSTMITTGEVSCVKYEAVASVVSIISTQGFFGLFTARAYAISGNRKFVLLLLLPLDLARLINGIISTTTVTEICRKDDDLPPSLLHSFNVSHVAEGDVQSSLNIATQTFCFIITVYHTYGRWRIFRKSPGQGKNLTVLIFEQGVYEFGLMAVLVILINILIRVLPGHSRSFGNATPINISIPTVLLGRFCLSLRNRNAPEISAAQTKYPSGYSWSSSQAKLLAEFGERSPTSSTTRFSQQSRASKRSVTRRVSDDIPLTTYSPVSVLYRHDEELEDELDDEPEGVAGGRDDVETPLTSTVHDRD